MGKAARPVSCSGPTTSGVWDRVAEMSRILCSPDCERPLSHADAACRPRAMAGPGSGRDLFHGCCLGFRSSGNLPCLIRRRTFVPQLLRSGRGDARVLLWHDRLLRFIQRGTVADIQGLCRTLSIPLVVPKRFKNQLLFNPARGFL